jgi:hypothetical protein
VVYTIGETKKNLIYGVSVAGFFAFWCRKYDSESEVSTYDGSTSSLKKINATSTKKYGKHP